MAKALNLLRLDQIRIDGGTQPRTAINEAVVAEYGEAIGSGVTMPKIVVFFDGTDFWLADGFHRYHGHRAAGAAEIDCDVRSGTRRDAVLYSVGANDAHGLRRSNADKHKAVMTLLNDPEWSKWSDGEVAKQCNVGRTMVAVARASLAGTVSEKPAERTFINKHGTESVMKTGAIGKAAREFDPIPVREDEPEVDAFVQERIAAQMAEEQMAADMPTQAELLIEAEQERKAAEARAEQLEAALATDDTKAALLVAIKRADHAVRRQGELMEDAAASKKRAEFYERQLARCGKAMGIRDLDKVAPAVEALARTAKAPA